MNSITRLAIRTVLFDLDGTLVDTAPDLTYCLNILRQRYGLATLSEDTVRPAVSHGAAAITQLGFDMQPSDPRFEILRQELLDLYQENILVKSCLFEGMHELLDNIEQMKINWGIVTNKPKRFTEPLINGLGISTRASCIISGDSTEYKKPHPHPIKLACELSGSLPNQCVYIGDAQRDIVAGNSAGTKTLIALFGYLAIADTPASWGADGSINEPLEISDWIVNFHD